MAIEESRKRVSLNSVRHVFASLVWPRRWVLLIGLGLRTLSLVPSQIPHIKRVIRSVDIVTCERLARKVGSLDSERKVYSTLREELRKVLPEADDGWTVS